MTWADTTWGTTQWAVDAGGEPPPAPIGFFIRRPVTVWATIDGRAVRFTDWQADSSVNHGYRTLTGKVPDTVTWAEQEAPIRLWASDGTEVWAGKLTIDPQKDRGQLGVRAEGYANRLAAQRARMFYRVDGGEGFVDAEGDPHIDANGDPVYGNSEKFDLEVRRGLILWRLGDGATAYALDNQHAVVLWMEDALITRYEFRVGVSVSFGNMTLQTHQATGPDGSRTLEGTHALNIAGSPTTYARTLTTPADLLSVRLRVTNAFTPGQKQNVRLSKIRVYGRTANDSFSASEVVSDVGTNAGLDVTQVQENGLGVLPLDWNDDHPDLLTFMAELTDWQWGAYGLSSDGTPMLHFGPWEKVWTGYQSMTVGPTWENLRRFNKVRVPFTYLSGAEGFGVATADPDPFPDEEVAIETEALYSPQSSKALANAVAAAQAPYWASKRVGGRVSIGRVTDENGLTDRLAIRPGHLLNVADREDLEPQRIHGVSLKHSAQTGAIDVVAELNDEFNPIRLLAQLQKDRRRRVRRGARRELH